MPLTQGNTAKLYCVDLIDQMAAEGRASSILDLGCGDARNFPALLRKHAGLRYVGIEPSPSACDQARRALEGLTAEIVNEYAYDVRRGPFDVVVSFSVLEHVYRRHRYLEAVKANLAPDGLALMNYDAGHFVSLAPPRQRGIERWKSRLGKILARFGHEAYYQAFVRDADFRSLIDEVGLRIVEEKLFNTDLKNVYKAVPSTRRSEFTERWLAFELYLNTLGIEYHDALAPVFRTRNFVLAHA